MFGGALAQGADPPAAVDAPAAWPDPQTEQTPAPDPLPLYPDPGRPRVIVPENVAPAGERIVAGLSSDAVAITASFDGSDILIYGAIKRETPIPPGPPVQVIVTVEGPSQAITIREKQRRLGVWVNTRALTVGAAPSFYAVAASTGLAGILSPEVDTRYRISVPLAMRSYGGPIEVDDPVPFTTALLRLREKSGMYRTDENSVQVVDQTLIRANIALPANLIEGDYKTRIFLLRDGEVIDVHRAPIEVRKVGVERWLYRLAFDQPLIYGIMSLAVAVIAGWGASAVFRLLRER